MNEQQIKEVLAYLDEKKEQPDHIRQGQCRKENCHIVEIKDGLVVHEGRTYFYNWGYEYARPDDGLAQVYLVDVPIRADKVKPVRLYKEMNERNQFFRDRSGDSLPMFSIRHWLNNFEFECKKEQLTIYKMHSYTDGIGFDYEHSMRNGLSMGRVTITDRVKFLRNVVLPQVHGIRIPMFLLTPEFENYLLRESHMILDLEAWFNNNSYDIDDETDPYEGSYSVNSIVFRNMNGFNDIVNKYWKSFNGEKYLQHLS